MRGTLIINTFLTHNDQELQIMQRTKQKIIFNTEMVSVLMPWQ